jgi:hypothetical protein
MNVELRLPKKLVTETPNAIAVMAMSRSSKAGTQWIPKSLVVEKSPCGSRIDNSGQHPYTVEMYRVVIPFWFYKKNEHQLTHIFNNKQHFSITI